MSGRWNCITLTLIPYIIKYLNTWNPYKFELEYWNPKYNDLTPRTKRSLLFLIITHGMVVWSNQSSTTAKHCPAPQPIERTGRGKLFEMFTGRNWLTRSPFPQLPCSFHPHVHSWPRRSRAMECSDPAAIETIPSSCTTLWGEWSQVLEISGLPSCPYVLRPNE